MPLHANVQHFKKGKKQPFNIVDEFLVLSPKRKVLLCDCLFAEGCNAFQNMVKLLWPDAGARDVKKLEKFLYLLKNTVH